MAWTAIEVGFWAVPDLCAQDVEPCFEVRATPLVANLAHDGHGLSEYTWLTKYDNLAPSCFPLCCAALYSYYFDVA